VTPASSLAQAGTSQPGLPPFRCSTAARERDDPLVGTAPPARRWLLIEHPGPWRRDALSGAGFDQVTRERLMSAAARNEARILLIRRHGRVQTRAERAWAVLRYDGGPTWGTWAEPAHLVTAIDALDAKPDGITGRASQLLLVCAHGIHDVCCAVRGRPVAAALAAEWPDVTWECSHVGGDRFAPNLLVLPDGTYYGNLDPVTAVQAVRDHYAGRVSTGFFRGTALALPPAQVAIAAAYARLGPAGARDVEVSVMQHLDDRWLIHLRGRGPIPERLTAVVRVTRRQPAKLTCQAQHETSALQYEVASLDWQGSG
jgi:hypothetical protein